MSTNVMKTTKPKYLKRRNPVGLLSGDVDPEEASQVQKAFMSRFISGTSSDFTMYQGYEIPVDGVFPSTKQILRSLSANGAVFIETDDGFGQFVVTQLLKIADHVGIQYHHTQNNLLLWDKAEHFKFVYLETNPV